MSDREPHLTYLDFTGEVGRYAGFGRGEANGDRAWTDDQAQRVEQAVTTGQSNFYRCVSMDPGVRGHQWTFLRPERVLTIPDGASEILLPLDCGQQVDGVGVFSASGGVVSVLRQTVYSEIRALAASTPDRTGMPVCYAVEPCKDPGQGRQRWRLIVFPEADRDVTLRVAYPIIPELMTKAQPFHWGGAQHSQTVLAACVAAYELFDDDVAPGQGARWMYYETLLSTSVEQDRRSRPSYLGLNGDASDERWRLDRWRGGLGEGWTRYAGDIVTVNGLTPT